jgi:hypothetical protein
MGHEFSTNKKTRAYVDSAEPNSDEPMRKLAEELGLKSPYTTRGESIPMDKAWDKFNREIVAKKKVILRNGLAALDLGSPRLLFSRKAGCSCGCSPGFIIASPRNTDVYISPLKSHDDTLGRLTVRLALCEKEISELRQRQTNLDYDTIGVLVNDTEEAAKLAKEHGKLVEQISDWHVRDSRLVDKRHDS